MLPLLRIPGEPLVEQCIQGHGTALSRRQTQAGERDCIESGGPSPFQGAFLFFVDGGGGAPFPGTYIYIYIV